MSTRYPAVSRMSNAAIAVPGWKWLLKVSGQRSTGGPSQFRIDRLRNIRTNVAGAKRGIRRSGATPPTRLTAELKPGDREMKLATDGAIAANLDHQGMRPME